MVIDSSALIAIVLHEPERHAFLSAIDADTRRFMSAVSLIEVGVVGASRLGDVSFESIPLLIDSLEISVVSLSKEQASIALDAYRRFGKGRHPARLNMGDCCSYALARDLGEPLLFKGNDFAQTDIVPALPPS